MSSLTSENAETKVGVFWDVEECPVPDGMEPSLVCENIKLALEKKGYRPCNVSIRVYGEKNNKFKDDFLLADIMFLPAGDARARYMRMGDDFFCWGFDNRKSTLMVMSRDSTEFASSLTMYKNLNFNILVAQPENAHKRCPDCRRPLEMIITDEWIWESLSAGGDPITKTQEPDLSAGGDPITKTQEPDLSAGGDPITKTQEPDLSAGGDPITKTQEPDLSAGGDPITKTQEPDLSAGGDPITKTQEPDLCYSSH